MEVSALDEIVLEQIGRLTPRMTAELHTRTANVWGPVARRSVERVLARLSKHGHIRRTPDGYLR